jgi:threonine dehydratase
MVVGGQGTCGYEISQQLPVMYESVRNNEMITMDTQPTLADTCAGGM